MRGSLWIAGWLLAGLCAGHAAAVEIKVLSAGAVEPGVHKAVAAFEAATGHQARVTFNTAPRIRQRITEGESWDVVIAPPALLDQIGQGGRLDAERVSVGRVGLGVVVRPDAPVPDISRTETLQQALRQADSLVFNRASTGLYLESLLRKMGLYAELEGKITRYPDGAAVLEHVLRGKGREIGFGAITEILLYRDKGLKLVGPLPADIQNYTAYSAAAMAGAAQPQAARDFVRYLGSAPGQALFSAAGIEP